MFIVVAADENVLKVPEFRIVGVFLIVIMYGFC